MGKGDRRGKAKQELADAVALAPVPRKEKDGKSTRAKRTAQKLSERDPQKAALQARARMMGVDDTVRNRQAMRSQALGEAAGRAIHIGCDPDTAERLWRVYADFTATEERYARTVLGKGLHAKTAKIETMPERFETRPDDRLDLRDEDQRHRDAVNAWMRWRGYIGQLHSHEQHAIFAVVRGRVEPVVDAALTQPGKRFVEAIEKLSEICK